MKVVEKSGKTIDDAINAALQELGVERDRVKIEILEQPSKGFLGIFGARLAKVRVSYDDNPGELAKEFIESICRTMGIEASVSYEYKDGYWVINIEGSELGLLIGRRGDTLEALQYLTNLAVSRRVSEKVKIIVDIEGYRKRREETLVRLAKRLSEKVKRTGNRIVLEPMNPHERRIIHTALQNEPRILTFSEGEEPNRRVVISLKRGKDIS